MRIIHEIALSDRTAEMLERIFTPSHTDKILEALKIQMSAIDKLKEAVNSVDTNATEGFRAIGDAMTELAADIAGLPANADVEAEAQRLSGVASNIAAATAQIGQGIRDAIATAPAEAPAETTTGGTSETAPADSPQPAEGTDTSPASESGPTDVSESTDTATATEADERDEIS